MRVMGLDLSFLVLREICVKQKQKTSKKFLYHRVGQLNLKKQPCTIWPLRDHEVDIKGERAQADRPGIDHNEIVIENAFDVTVRQ